MSNKRSVVLKGSPTFNEESVAGAAVKPGYLVKQGAGNVVVQNTAGANCERTFAAERDELGTGIDNTFQGEGTGSAFYASGDTVKVAACYPGCEVTAFLASGYVVAVGGQLQAHSNGELRPLEASQAPLGVALDAVSAQALVPTAIRVRVQ